MTADARVLGAAWAATAEDPLGPGDPLEVARLVRRALAAAGRRAVDVVGLVLVADLAPDPVALARFARRALGPAGADAPVRGRAGDGAHEARCAAASELAAGLLRGDVAAPAAIAGTPERAGPATGGVAIAVALGPGAEATVRCVVLRD